jgi:hypothetical protein
MHMSGSWLDVAIDSRANTIAVLWLLVLHKETFQLVLHTETFQLALKLRPSRRTNGCGANPLRNINLAAAHATPYS